MDFEIIDFHAHPFPDAAHNICAHKDCVPMTEQTIVELCRRLGISKVCGSVIEVGNNEDRRACAVFLIHSTLDAAFSASSAAM